MTPQQAQKLLVPSNEQNGDVLSCTFKTKNHLEVGSYTFNIVADDGKRHTATGDMSFQITASGTTGGNLSYPTSGSGKLKLTGTASSSPDWAYRLIGQGTPSANYQLTMKHM